MSKFLEYQELALQVKALQEQMDEMKPELLEEMNDQEKLTTEIGGVFSVRFRNNYKYSEEITSEEERIKALKKEEEIDGIAINNPTRYIQYDSPKTKKEKTL